MYLILICLAAASMNQTTKWMGPLNLLVNDVDVLVVARYLGHAGWYETRYLTPQGTPHTPDLSAYIYKYRFQPVLVLKGTNLGSEFVVLHDYSSKPGSKDPRETRWAGRIIDEPGSLMLVFGDRPPASLILHTAGPEVFFRAESRDQVYYAFPDPTPKLPNGTYTLEGATPVEKYVAVLSQAYAIDPDRNREYLRLMLGIKPRWKKENGRVVLADREMDGPGFFEFARLTIVPRLFSVAGDNIVRKLTAMYYSYVLGDTVWVGPHRQLISVLDQTWSDPEAEGLVDGLIGTREYLHGMLEARLADIRCAAIRSLVRELPNKDPIVSRLASDASAAVRHCAAEWLNDLRTYYHDRGFRDAPKARFGRNHEILNYDEMVRYWTGR